MPGRIAGQVFSHILLDRPAPGFKERNQVLLHFLREQLQPYVHLALIVFRDVKNGLVFRKEVDEWLPPKDLLELEKAREECGIEFVKVTAAHVRGYRYI